MSVHVGDPFEGEGTSQDTTVFAQLVAQLLLVVPSHFIQGTTCPRILLSSYDGQLSRFKVQGVCVCACVCVCVRVCVCV